ncbi:hypothetical protein FQA39_LY06768 [Lamprigera yunnana]|nr:hypothetical protein FQA39_LY06768 [Lamprigera yunnana]
MFKKGYHKTLDIDDLYNPISSDKSRTLGDRLESKWTKHVEKMKKLNKKPSLLKVLVQTFWPEYLYLGILLVFLDIILRLLSPIMLGELLDYFRADSEKTKNEAFLYAGAVVAVNAANALLINQYVMGAFHYGMKVRAACCAIIYRKTLKLSKTALGETASGKVVNLLSNDVSRFDIVSIFIHHMWVAPTTSLIVLYFLWSEARYAGLIGMIPVFLVAPLQSYTGKLTAIYRRQTAYKTDERVRLMDEIIAGVQVIKMYAWEIPFENIIKQARKLELKIITKISYVRGLFMTFNLFTTRVSLFCSLLTMVLMGDEITAPRVFVFMTYFNILSQVMSSMFVRGISEIAEALVAVKRLQEFMVNEEFVDRPSSKNNNESKINYNTPILLLQNLTCKWNAKLQENALNGVNVTLNRGELLGVIGSVGSGKSSFLQTILGELDIVEGSMELNGSISYASQEPWVFPATVRQNILFGNEYNKERYNEVVRVCNLEKDFQQFSDGDMSVVGDRGASLSGGQKARINLARAVYHKADIYLMDDPLSAVDTHVGKHLYEECINGFLANKTRILVTHQVTHLKDADNIIILENGNIEIQGKYNYLAASSNTYAQLLIAEQEVTEEEKKPEGFKLVRQISCTRASSLTSSRSETSIIESLLQEEEEEEEDEFKFKAKDLQESSSKGKIKGSLFLKYLLAGGNWCFVGTVLCLYIVTQASASAVDYFVSYWVKVEELRTEYIIKHNDTAAADFSELPTYNFLYIYGGLIIFLFIIALTRSLTFYKLAMLASKNLHNSMFVNVISATMRFFDINPSGRILNRFSKDIGTIDELLPKVILDAGQIILMMFGSLILVTIINPYFLIPTCIIGCFFLLCRMVFLRSSKNIKRLEGMTRSPVFTHLNASLHGLTTIRAYGAQDILKMEFDKHQDLHTSAWYMYIAASSAFGFSLDILCFIYTGLVTFSFLMIGEKTTGGDVGLAITQATALTGLVQWGMRQSAEISNHLMSVERVLEYNTIPTEKQPVLPKTPKKEEWPRNGKISFHNLGLRYAEGTELMLKNLNFIIYPKEKIGIVGRTGAGKSSLIAALFRLAPIEGEIEIDGIYTKDLMLQDLRSKISIIPQDPVLFSGTLRYNLDPFEEYPDDVLYKALNEVELKDPANIINRLENRVMDGGSNYSVGQRQLVCLARAIIRNNKILMLDEATANVDPQTDAVIQNTIRKKFVDCTVLTVAHRLNTIMDSDRVLVMDSGTMVEFNHPHLLLQNHKSIFFKMVAETGRNMTEQLKKIARQNYEQKHGVPE